MCAAIPYKGETQQHPHRKWNLPCRRQVGRTSLFLQMSWENPFAFQMEIESFPKILPEDDSVSITASGDMSDDDEEEEDEESPGYQLGVEVQQTAAGGTTLHEVDWALIGRLLFLPRLDGKFLVPTTSTVHQALPPFQDCMDDLTKYWERPLLSRVPVYGFSSLDMAGMQERGWSHMPSMEASLAGHLDPRSAVGLSTIAPKLPQRSDHFSASIFEKIYKSSTQTGRATNAITLLLAYITELEEEMTGALTQGNDVIELWTEIRTVTDLTLRSSRCLAQSTGRTKLCIESASAARERGGNNGDRSLAL
ncbi:hypothetical protein G5714_000027 [Onychostoma macrolepis]|uniref:Uncharacterized protein n=1 Tax=Onychostoma macrolepis TaxID=369639 RepID=A0A7J6DF65_9TELE|nr:hypothetical protein G5714_000027 [Onychostoma macrolepis]